MSKIKEFDKKNVKQMSDEMLVAMKTVAKKYGVEISKKGGSYADFEATLKFRISMVEKDGGNKQTKHDWNKYADIYGLKKEWLGESFKDGKDTFTIIGLKTSSRKNVVIIENQNGNQFVTTAQSINQSMGA